MKKDTGPKHKTTVSINAELWDRFDDQIKPRLGVRDYSPALEILISKWLDDAKNSNQSDIQSTDDLGVVPAPVRAKKVYIEPELEDLQALIAQAWRDKHDGAAQLVVSVLRTYGESKKRKDRHQSGREAERDAS